MPIPFPGMDPYLESQGYWPDFHARFVTYWCDALADVLPEGYEARLDERVSLVELPAREIREPDVSLLRRETKQPAAGLTSSVATFEPVTIPLVIEEETREAYIQVLHRPERSLVAVLELLPPSNKEQPGRSAYLAKRNALLHRGCPACS
jgi:hypothetical protein